MQRISQGFLAALLIAVTLTAISIGLWARPGHAETDLNKPQAAAQTALLSAAQLYTQGDYALAAQAYSQLIDQGYANVELFYNRGLAYYQAGEPAAALESLRTAAALAPRDAQIRAALAQVEAASPPALTAPANGLVDQVNTVAGRWLTRDEMALLALALWLVLTGLLLAATMRRKPRLSES